jgi:hypothetical protein
MLVSNFQYNQKPYLHTRNHLIGYPVFSFGHNNWSQFTRYKTKCIVVKSIQFGSLPESTEYLRANKHNSRACQHSPVEEPPNQPKKPPVKEPSPKEPDREPPPNPPSPPSGPPVEEPPNEPGGSPVKEPPPREPDRKPPRKPPVRMDSTSTDLL